MEVYLKKKMVLLTKKLFKDDEKLEEKRLETEWSNKIKGAYGWSCAVCGSVFKPNAHHIVPREWKQYKFSTDNGISLCTNHHKFSRTLSAHNNPLAFFMWLEKYKPELYIIAKERQKEINKHERNL